VDPGVRQGAGSRATRRNVLLPLVAGMVVDIGGPLSHAAIVAREMGIHCVVNTGDAVTRITTGMRIRLDAANGVVIILHANALQPRPIKAFKP